MREYKYFGTCAAGTQAIIKKLLQQQIDDINNIEIYEGAVIFSTRYTYDRLNLYCFKNLFCIIDSYEGRNDNNIIEKHIRRVLKKKISNDVMSNSITKHLTFRLVISKENKLISIKPDLRCQIEHYISVKSRLKLERSKGDVEFWFLSRREGICYFMKRLSRHPSYDKILKRGELCPEIAYLMNWLAEPDKNDVFLDPFCGYGSIPEQRLKHFVFKYMYVSDINNNVLQHTRKKLRRILGLKCEILNSDVKTLEDKIGRESINKIVTDPPWGIYEKIDDIVGFYCDMLKVFGNILKPQGILVILSAKKEELLQAVKYTGVFNIVDRYDILVSGKKAAIFKAIHK